MENSEDWYAIIRSGLEYTHSIVQMKGNWSATKIFISKIVPSPHSGNNRLILLLDSEHWGLKKYNTETGIVFDKIFIYNLISF